MILERLSWRVTCPNHTSSRLLTATRRSSCGLIKTLILLCNQSLVLYSKKDKRKSFLRRLVSKTWIFFPVSKPGPCFTATEEDGGDKRLVELELACEADVLHPQILFSLAIAAIAEAILIQTSVEQVPSSHRAAPKYWSPLTSGRSC